MDIQKNDIVEVSIETLGYRGEGIARIDRIPLFVVGALVGERIRAAVILVKKDYYVGKLLEVLVTSPHRVQPLCPLFGRCGGCDLQHLDYDGQLKYKAEQVTDALKKIAGITVKAHDCVPSGKIYGYRNKLSLPVRSAAGKVKVGFFAYNTHRIVETESCRLQSPRVNSVLAAFRQWMETQSAYDEETGRGNVKHLSIRELGDYLTVTVVTAARSDLSALAESLKQFGDFALFQNINKRDDNVIFGERTFLAGGSERAVRLYGLTATVHPVAFLQVNSDVAEEVYSRICSDLYASGAKRVLDAYCGGGLLTAMLSNAVESVVGVEIVPEAIASARKLAEGNDITNVIFVEADCAAAIPELTETENFDAIVLDPPRSGCDEKVITAINGSNAPILYYISCNPATLARDLSRLTNYTPTNITPFDMFPQTKHVETLCVLHKVSTCNEINPADL